MKTVYKTDVVYLPKDIVELIMSHNNLQTQKEWNELIAKIVEEYFSNTQDR